MDFSFLLLYNAIIKGERYMNDPTLFQQSSDLHEINNIGMYYCGKRVATKNHTYGPEIRNYYLLVLVNKGEAIFYHKNGIKKLRAHDLLIMYPEEKIHYKATTPWSIQWVGLYGKSVEQYLNLLPVSREKPILHLEQYYETERILNELYENSKERSDSSRFNQLSLIYQFFSTLFQNAKTKKTGSIVESAKKIIDYNFNTPISIDDIAKTLYANTTYLTKRFSKQYGYSPKEYMLKKRMEFSTTLLLTTDLSVMEISNSVGYEDQLYFSRIFKKKIGVSPLEYRKRAKSDIIQ